MLSKDHPDLSELAYHIVLLRDFWKRLDSSAQSRNGFKALRNMIEIALGVGDADQIAQAVLEELDLIKPTAAGAVVDPEGIEVLFISTLLQEKTDPLSVPAATNYWARVFQTTTHTQTTHT